MKKTLRLPMKKHFDKERNNFKEKNYFNKIKFSASKENQNTSSLIN